MNRETRIGMNEAVFRAVNERIQEVADTFHLTSEPLDLICECGDASCTERISLTRKDYELLRADPHYFAVAPGHGARDVEEVVERRSGYEIVKKLKGAPEKIARKTDPRG